MVQDSVRTREYEEDGIRNRVFESRAETIVKLDRTERQEPAIGTEDSDRIDSMHVEARRTGIPFLVSAQALNHPCWLLEERWALLGNVQGTSPQFVLMNAIYDYHPAHMTGHHSPKPNIFSGL